MSDLAADIHRDWSAAGVVDAKIAITTTSETLTQDLVTALAGAKKIRVLQLELHTLTATTIRLRSGTDNSTGTGDIPVGPSGAPGATTRSTGAS